MAASDFDALDKLAQSPLPATLGHVVTLLKPILTRVTSGFQRRDAQMAELKSRLDKQAQQLSALQQQLAAVEKKSQQ